MGESKSFRLGERGHGFASVEDRHERWWRNSRAHVWFPLGRARGPEGDDGWRADVGGQWVHGFAKHHRLRLKVSTTGEETLDVAYGLPFFQHYWALNVQRPDGTTRCYMLDKGLNDAIDRRRLADGETDPWEHDRDCKRCHGLGVVPRSRQVRLPGVRFTIALGLTGVDWCLGSDPQSWSRNEPLKERLRRNHLTWWKVGWHGGAEEATVLDTTVSAVHLPEGAYPVTVTLKRWRWRVLVGPYRLTRGSKRWLRFYLPILRKVSYYAEVDASDTGGLPKPGKGENSWDCGQDALFSTSVRVARPYEFDRREWLAAALAKATESVLRDRIRHGSGVGDTGA